jgi:hypothetical protein
MDISLMRAELSVKNAKITVPNAHLLTSALNVMMATRKLLLEKLMNALNTM